MGAFGIKNFQNDSAMDFAEEFLENPTVDALEEALLIANDSSDHLEGEEYLEVDEACAALAAAEVLAASLGKPATDFPKKLQEAVLIIPTTPKLQKLARKVVKKVRTKSELQELWAEGDKLNEWLDVQKDLLNRLK
jgi:hypothetical protein